MICIFFLVELLAIDIEMDEDVFEACLFCSFLLAFKYVFLMECRTGSLGCFWMGHGNTSFPVSCNSDNSGIPFFALLCLMEIVILYKIARTSSLSLQYMYIWVFIIIFVPGDSFIRIWSRYSS